MPDFVIPEAIRQKARRNRNILWIGGGVVVLASTGAILYALPAGPSVARDTVVLARVDQGDFSISVEAPGTLVPRRPRFIAAPSTGTVTAVSVEPGDAVQAGQEVVKLANPALHAALTAADANVADAHATMISTAADLDNQMLSLQSDLAAANATAQSASLRAQAEQDLESDHIIAELDYREAVLAARTARLQLGISRQRVSAFSRNEVAQLQAQQVKVAAFAAASREAAMDIANLTVRASDAGIVQSVSAQLGQTLNLGDPIAQIAALDDLKAALAIAPSDAGKIVTGQTAVIQLNDANDTVIDGVVSRVSPKVEDDSVIVDVTLPSRLPAGTRPNMAVLGEISIATMRKTLYVSRPVDAEPNSDFDVYRIEGSKAILTRVRFGKATMDEIQILSGLAAGDQIIASDTSNLENQKQVSLR